MVSIGMQGHTTASTKLNMITLLTFPGILLVLPPSFPPYKVFLSPPMGVTDTL